MDKKFMTEALALAKLAAESGDVPVGAVVVKNGEIIGKGLNLREANKDATAHAEVVAIREASKRLGGWHLDDCELYVTLEPCPMCTGAIINARIKTVIFGAYDSKMGCMDSVINLCDYPFNHQPEIYGGIMEDDCLLVLQNFFKNLRENG